MLRRFSRFFLRYSVAAVLFVLSALTPLAVQDARGTVVGRVTDPSGAVIVEAAIEITNVATGVRTPAKSNKAGNFRIPYLLPGDYTLKVEFQGFHTFVRPGIQVRVGETVEVNVALQVGDATHAVEVTAETPLLSTAEASLGQVVDQRRVVELPTFGGSAVSLVLLAPGTVNGTDMRQADRASNNVNSQFSVNGAGMYNNEFTIDSVSNTLANTQGNSNSGRVAFIPPQTAVSEFKNADRVFRRLDWTHQRIHHERGHQERHQ